MGLLASGRGIRYLLKSRVSDVDEFIDTLERIAEGGSVVDPALVQELVPHAVATTRSLRSARGSATCWR
jgi:DNA-binding NarL/FixJ family response regulator